MKKISLLLLALTGAGALALAPTKAKSVDATDTHKLTFSSLNSEYSCSSTTNGWWDSFGNSIYSVREGNLVLDFAANTGNPTLVGYSNPGVITLLQGHEYVVEFELKNSTIDSFQLYVQNSEGWTEVATLGFNTEWQAYSYTFEATLDNSNIAFQQETGLSTVEIRDMYIYESGRKLTYGETIGELPRLPKDAISWGIDGTPITSASAFNYNEDKVAKPMYETSLINAFTLNGKNIAEDSNTFVTGNQFDSITYDGEKIEITSSEAAKYHLTDEYDVVAGKTYYLIGKYKTTEGSGIHIGINDPWALAVTSGSSRQYEPFMLEYTATTTRKIRFIFQSGYQNLGVARFSIKDMYFGEGVKVNYGSAFTNLPEKLEETDGWKIGNDILTTSSINTYGTNENIGTYLLNPYYKLYFPLNNYVGNTATDLNLTNVGSVNQQVLNAVEGHKYYVEFEFKTSESCGLKPWVVDSNQWMNVGYEGITSPDSFTKVRFTYTSNSTGELYILIQNAYNDVPANTPVFEVKNYVAYEVMSLQSGTALTYLPTLPTSSNPDYIPQSWVINGTEVQVGSTFIAAGDVYATISYATPSYTLTFTGTNGTVATSSVKYDEEIGTLPEVPEANEGHHYVWAIDGTEITATTKYAFNENKSATLVEIANVYVLTFKNGTTTMSIKNIEYGTKIESFPSYEADADYDYHWEIDGETVTTDTVYAYTQNKTCNLVKTLKTYTATFMAGDVEVGTVTFNKNGYLGSLPQVPNKDGYEGSWEQVSFENHDIVVNATYSAKTYEIYFLDSTGARIAMYRIKYGQSYFDVIPTWPAAPEVEGYTFVSYQIAGQDVSILDTFNFTSNQALVAVYTKNEEPQKGEKKGCGGSIIASSIIVSSLSILGATLVLTNKKKED